MPASLLQREACTGWDSILPAYQVTPVPAGNTSRFIARRRGAIGSPAPYDVAVLQRTDRSPTSQSPMGLSTGGARVKEPRASSAKSRDVVT